MVDRGTFTNIMQDLTFVDERVRSHAPIDNMTPLPEKWQPDNWSVICGRGKECFEHFGNRRFRVLVDINLEKYAQAKTKIEKSLIVMGILDAVREGSQKGGFVKHNSKIQRWFEVGDEVAREKIGQQFRISLAAQKKSGQPDNKKSSISSSKSAERRSKCKSAIVARKRKLPVASRDGISTITSGCDQADFDENKTSPRLSSSCDASSTPIPQIIDIFKPFPLYRDHAEPCTEPTKLEDEQGVLDCDFDLVSDHDADDILRMLA